MTKNNYHASLILEQVACSALNIDVGDGGRLNGTIVAGSIEAGNAYMALVAALSPYYKEDKQNHRDLINSFLEKFHYLDDSELDRERYTEGVALSAEKLKELLSKLK